MNFKLTPEQIKLIDNINFASSKLLKVDHIVDYENYLHFLSINTKLLNLNFNQIENKIDGTIELFDHQNNEDEICKCCFVDRKFCICSNEPKTETK